MTVPLGYHVGESLKATVFGLGSYYSLKYSRSLAVGWYEQRLLIAIDNIGNIVMAFNRAYNNIKAMCGEAFASRFSNLSYASYVVVPIFYYLSNALEGSKYVNIRKFVNFLNLHIPDLTFIAGFVHSTVALYLGIAPISNVIYLAFQVFTILETGIFWTKPVENNGLLFSIKNGVVVRFYQPYLAKTATVFSPIFDFLYKGIIQKITVIFALFAKFAPSSLTRKIVQATPLYPSKASLQAQKNLRPKIVPTPTKIQPQWVDRTNDLCLTHQHLRPFKIEDQFPKKTLSQLEKAVQRRLIEDTDPWLNEKNDSGPEPQTNREKLIHLLGKDKPGHLVTHIRNTQTNLEKQDKTIYLKNIFGSLIQDWDDGKKMLIAYHRDFLCDPATGSTIKEVCLQVYPKTIQGSLSDSEKRIHVGMLLILQQFRDRLFLRYFQYLLMIYKQGDSFHQKEKKQYYQKVKNFHVLTLEWWHDLAHFLRTAFVAGGVQLAHKYLGYIASHRHLMNVEIAKLGTNFGISTYEEAKKDTEAQLQRSLNYSSELLDALTEPSREIIDSLLQDGYQKEYLEELIESILTQEDDRLPFDLVYQHICAKAQKFKQLIAADIDAMSDCDIDAVQRRSLQREFLVKYLPQVLYDLGLFAFEQQA